MTNDTRKRVYVTTVAVILLFALLLMPQWLQCSALRSLASQVAVGAQTVTGCAWRGLQALWGSHPVTIRLDGMANAPGEGDNSSDQTAADEFPSWWKLQGENEYLRLELERAEHRQSELKTENLNLQKLLKMSNQTEQYSICVARPVYREPLSDYYSTLLIDRGSVDGLKPGHAVLSSSGLVGQVGETYPHRAVVRLLGNPNFTMSCRVPQRQVDGIISNDERLLVYEQLEQRKDLVVSDSSEPALGSSSSQKRPSLLYPPRTLSVSATSNLLFDAVKPGDQVVTSSLGEPNLLDGIIIGTVSRTVTDTAGAPWLQVVPAADLRQLPFLFVAIPKGE